jgi:hypothetical protein
MQGKKKNGENTQGRQKLKTRDRRNQSTAQSTQKQTYKEYNERIGEENRKKKESTLYVVLNPSSP